MSYSSRVYRQRNPRAKEESKEESFFSKQHDAKKGSRKTGFFQAKLAVNEPGDHHEKEADAVAKTVVEKTDNGPVVQNKKISSIQRLSTPAEDEKLATNDARMKKDKDIQEKAMEPEKEKKEVQKKDEPKKEDEDMKKGAVQKAPEPDKEKKDVQKKDEPKKEEEDMKKGAVQKAPEPDKEKKDVQKKDEPKKEEEDKKTAAVQRKSESGSTGASPAVSAGIEQSTGRGDALPAATLHEMSAGFGVDFSKVRIHKDQESVHLNSELEAQAFTHGTDIYFNQGKFDPSSSEGKFLLAHELTHVVQQKGSELNTTIRRQPAPAHPPLQQPANITTPVPADAEQLRNGTVQADVNGVRVLIQPDARRGRGTGARTTFQQSGGGISNVKYNKGHVSGFDGPGQLVVRIQTTYQQRANRSGPSLYGRGTTSADQATGDTSLGFHEGHHGTDFMDFIAANPLPEFSGEIGMTKREFNRARRAYNIALRNYFRNMGQQSTADTDCVGTTIDEATGSHECVP